MKLTDYKYLSKGLGIGAIWFACAIVAIFAHLDSETITTIFKFGLTATIIITIW